MKKNPHRHLPLSPSKREMVYKLHSEGLYEKAIAVKIGIPIPCAAIIEAIVRCDSVCNPAVIEKRLFSIHVRQLPASEGKGWVVRIIDKEAINKND